MKKSGLGIKSYRNNIVLALVLMGACTFGLGLATYMYALILNQEDFPELAYLRNTKQELVTLEKSMLQSHALLNSYLNTATDADLIKWQELNNEMQAVLGKLESHFLNLSIQHKRTWNENSRTRQEIVKLQQKYFDQIKSRLADRSFYESKVKDAQQSAIYHQLIREVNDFLHPLYQQYNDQLNFFKLVVNNQIQQAENQLENRILGLKSLAIFFFIIASIIGIYFGFRIVRSLLDNLLSLKNTTKKLKKGEIPPKLKENGNESNLIVREVNSLIENLVNLKALANKVGAGAFDADVTVFENKGELGTALAEMKKSLAKVALEDQHRDWVNQGVSQFSTILQSNSENLSNLCNVLIHSLINYLKANQGAIYLISEQESQEVMEMMACYAWDRKKKVGFALHKGQGLVGQAWLEKEMIYLTDIPQDYVKIKSGLGGKNPTCLVIIPLRHNDEIVGAIELASFTAFEPYQIEFLKKLSFSIGTAISTTKNNERTKTLLEESQQMAEEMKAQEEEMRQNMEELVATQEDMKRTQEEIKTKEFNLNALINNTEDTIFAIDTNYCITVVNKVLSEKYKKFGIELKIGTNIIELLSGEAKIKWQERYDRTLAGERFTIIEETSGSGGERFSETFHNPIRDDQGRVIGASVISRDVTEMVKSKQEAERKQSILNALINNTNDTYFALDTEYRILIANKALKDRFKSVGIEMDEGQYIYDILPEADWPVWKERYDRALNGESFMIPQERKVNDNTLYIEGHYHPIVNENGKVIGASVMSRDITAYKDALTHKEHREAEIRKLRNAMGLEAKHSLDKYN